MSARSIRRGRERERRRRARRRAAVGAATITGALAFSSSAQAANYTVTSGADAGPNTLRAVVAQANLTGAADNVYFGAGVSNITLTTGEIPITQPLAIKGPGEALLTIDGNDSSRIFSIATGVVEPVSISGVTMVDGKSPGGPMGPYFYGGAIDSSDADLSIDNVTISSSYATRGGAAISSFGDLELTNATITDNVAHYEGGGLLVFGDLSITDSEITDNETQLGGKGGGIFHPGDELTVTGSEITGNETSTVGGSGSGGGIYSQGPFTIADSHFDGNTARGRGGGASLTLSGEEGTIVDSTFDNNYADGDAGGLFLSAATNTLPVVDVPSHASVERTSLSGNRAGDGGGVFTYASDGSSIRIEDSSAIGNIAYAAEGGGGALIHDDTTISNSTVQGNRLEPGPGRGAGVLASVSGGAPAAASPRIENSTVSYNGPGNGIFAVVDGPGPGTVELSSTIVADSSGADVAAEAVNPATFAGGFNLIESPGTAILSPSPAGSNVIGQDPQLAPPALNGGPTYTRVPAATSPAIDRGIANGLSSDQRGIARTQDGTAVPNAAGGDGTDIGAVERQDTPNAPDATVDARASAARKQAQKGRRVKIAIDVSASEAVDASASGTISVKTKGGRAKEVALPGSSARISPGGGRLVLQPGAAGARKVLKALKGRGKARAAIDVTLRDDAANEAATALTVKLTGKKKTTK